jgi:ribosome-associated protein
MTNDDEEEDVRSRRQLARAESRDAGERSAKLARTLMEIGEPALAKLQLDEEMRDAVDRARRVRTDQARRRAERALAGDIRRLDLDAVERQLADFKEGSVAEARRFKTAEEWRARLIAEGTAALSSFPGGADALLPDLIADAQRERATGRPAGAARKLFRHVAERLKTTAGS